MITSEISVFPLQIVTALNNITELLSNDVLRDLFSKLLGPNHLTAQAQ